MRKMWTSVWILHVLEKPLVRILMVTSSACVPGRGMVASFVRVGIDMCGCGWRLIIVGALAPRSTEKNAH